MPDQVREDGPHQPQDRLQLFGRPWRAPPCQSETHGVQLRVVGHQVVTAKLILLLEKKLLNFWTAKFDADNGAKGKIPVFPKEWRAVGLGSDSQCFKLIEYIYREASVPLDCLQTGAPKKCLYKFLHKNLTDTIKPSNIMHIGDKLLQLAATNSTDGTHLNTRVGFRFRCSSSNFNN